MTDFKTKQFDPNALQNSPICFIDILGFSNEIKQAGEDKSRLTEIVNLLYTLKYHPNILKLKKYGLKILTFSDSIIITHEMYKNIPNEVAIHNVILTAKLFQLMLLTKYRLSRGYLTDGLVYHKDGIICGSEYITAYEEEQKNPDPKIIVKKSVAEQHILEYKDTPKLTQIENGPYFIDYLEGLDQFKELGADPKTTLDSYIEKAIKNIEKFSDKTGVVEKWQWFTQYARSHREKLSD